MIFRILFTVLFCGLTVIRLIYKVKYHAFFSRSQIHDEGWGILLFRWLLGIPLLFGMLLYIVFPEVLPILFFRIPSFLRIAGFYLGVFCLILLWRVHHALGSSFSTSICIVNHDLVTSGPYRFVRHPMYTAYILLFIAAFLLSGSWLVGGAGCLIILSLMTVRLKKEEAVLLKLYGKRYQEYAGKTPRFFPRVRLHSGFN